MNNHQITNEVIWVTGASSGIGRQLALRLAQAGNQVLVTARNVEALNQLAREHDNIRVLAADISATDALQNLTQTLATYTPVLDRVILNAGVCEYFDISNPDWSMMQRVMAVNYFGAVNCLAAAYPLLLQSSAGHIVAMASQASRVPFPRAQAYGASKAALTYFIESLGVDLAETSISSTVVELGFVDTPMTASNDFPMPFKMTVDKTVQTLVEEMVARPRFIRFPKRLSWMVSVARSLSGLWYHQVAPRLSRAS
ncbi:MAG: short-chain dehydrogenase [Cellvibrionaceae bacterium]|nr:short-chain dehydrogenase [Cellvibrionaceae bacterium]|tara:strand:- start:3713 stop:4477 length:765 start_codon:yes stop_codon:yes gene_type:complete